MSGNVTYLTALLAGTVSFLSPCVLPLAPPYICYLAGISINQVTGEGAIPANIRWRTVLVAIFFVLGFSTIFILLGASASAIGRLLAGSLHILSRLGGVFIMIMGLHIVGLIRIPFLYRDTRYHGRIEQDGLMGAYLMGIAFAFGWTPCIGPVLAGILFLAANEETIHRGVVMLAAYSLGLGIPFILLAFAMKTFLYYAKKTRHYLGVVEKITGVFLIATGFAFMTGMTNRISFWLLELFPTLGQLG